MKHKANSSVSPSRLSRGEIKRNYLPGLCFGASGLLFSTDFSICLWPLSKLQWEKLPRRSEKIGVKAYISPSAETQFPATLSSPGRAILKINSPDSCQGLWRQPKTLRHFNSVTNGLMYFLLTVADKWAFYESSDGSVLLLLRPLVHYKQNAKCPGFNLNQSAVLEMRFGKSLIAFPWRTMVRLPFVVVPTVKLCLKEVLTSIYLAQRSIMA